MLNNYILILSHDKCSMFIVYVVKYAEYWFSYGKLNVVLLYRPTCKYPVFKF